MIRLGNISIQKRLLFLPLLFFLGLLALQIANFYVDRQLRQKVIFPNFEQQVLVGHQHALKASVEVEAATLAVRLKDLKSREEQIAAIVAETDPIRFFDDQSGYFFTYDLTGARVNVPINKSQNGQNLLTLTDKKGIRFVEQFVKAAKAGGGFVQYYFEKPGKGIQPKLSYVMMIPGTDFLIGTGVYIDNVESERAALQSNIEARHQEYRKYTLMLFFAVMGIIVASAFGLGQSVTHSIQRVIKDMLASSQELTAASAQVAGSSQRLAQAANHQAASLEETSSSLEELSSMTRNNTDNAHRASELTREARAAADSGATEMAGMNAAMSEIKTSSDEIAKIIKTIDEIAFQTNLLALNAAVEAARAGEAGKGFAVVADEVRNLAQRSAQAAKETAAKIEGAIASTAKGVAISGQVAQQLQAIIGKVRQVDELVAQVASASQEQSQGIQQVNTAVGQMDQVTQANAAAAEESASAAEELNAQSDTLNCAVAGLQRLVGDKLHRQSVSLPHVAPVKKTSRSPALLLGSANRVASFQEMAHARIPLTTSPATSVNRKSRP